MSKLYNAFSGMNPEKKYVVAQSGVIYPGDFVYLSSGYLAACGNAATHVLGRALAGGTQASTLPTTTVTSWPSTGATDIDWTAQPNPNAGGFSLVVVPVAMSYPGVGYNISVLGTLTRAMLGTSYGLGYKSLTDGNYYFIDVTNSTQKACKVMAINSLSVVTGITAYPAYSAITYYDATSSAYTATTTSSVVGYGGKLYVAIAATIPAGNTGAQYLPWYAQSAYWAPLGSAQIEIASAYNDTILA